MLNQQYDFTTNNRTNFKLYFTEDVTKAFANFAIKAETQDLNGRGQTRKELQKTYELERKCLLSKTYFVLNEEALYLFISYGNRLTMSLSYSQPLNEPLLEKAVEEVKRITHFINIIINQTKKNK